MTSWQRYARRGLAVFFVAFAAFVYVSLRERPQFAPPADVPRQDPNAVSETTGASALRLSGAERRYQVEATYQVGYEDGSIRFEQPRITVPKPDGRVYVLTADEAHVGPDQIEYEVRGNVRLEADDGFELRTSRARFTEHDEVVRMPDAVTFTRGRMRGSGVGATYDHAYDVLDVLAEAAIVMTDASGAVTLDGTAGRATLDRERDLLMLDDDVHVVREGQQTRADEARAHLSASEDVVTALELRGTARVEGGGGGIESMAARDIDLDYTDDGTIVERATLAVGAEIRLAGTGGAAGLRLAGEALDLELAPDGTILDATGEGVELGLPPEGDAPIRRIRADEFEAAGEEGRGLTTATFTRDVDYREGDGAIPDRVASARRLTLGLQDTRVERAVFEESARFEAGSLIAEARTLEYRPDEGRLRLSGSDRRGDPRFTDVQKMSVAADEIEARIDTHDLTATGEVRTSLHAAPAGDGAPDAARLPGLLAESTPVSVNAARLEYAAETGRAVYSGQAVLWQGTTTIRAATIEIDRQRGDLVATGDAHAVIALDGEEWVGRAGRIRYDDATRIVTYSQDAAEPMNGQGGDARHRAPVARLTGGNRDLQARRIAVVLAATGNGIARLEAETDLALVVDDRTASGARLRYDAADGGYEVSGTPSAPAVFCDGSRETEGGTLKFYESTASIEVDGDTRRSETRPCSAAPR